MAEGTATARATRRRIIERPRLTRLLDESQGRIKMLVAPAGYGKTTLARQWLTGKSASWYLASVASSDVAALASGLVQAAAVLLPGAGEAVRERIPVTAHPNEESDLLAGMLAGDLMAWPADAWLVIDDYHVIAGSGPAERFVEAVVVGTGLNLLLLSRQRPGWASSRRIMYGEMLEIDRAALAMTDDEARELVNLQDPHADDLLRLAQGWPAVIALASMTGAAPQGLPATPHLYDFFAEEVYRRIDAGVRRVLCELALLETGGRSLVLEQLPRSEVERVFSVGAEHGFLTSSGGRAEIHPLLRDFLIRKLGEEDADGLSEVVLRAVTTLIQHLLWDEAFGLIERSHAAKLIPSLVEAGMDTMLAAGRISTLRTWIALAPQDAPAIRLALAELAFREGRFHESESLASLAARDDGTPSNFRARALVAAGRAAHASSREEQAGGYYARAAGLATLAETQRIAVMGELSSAIELEDPDAITLLETLGPADTLEPDERVVLVSRTINLQTRFGLPVSIEDGRAMWQTLDHVRDPVARSSFRNVFAYTLAAMGYYDEAMSVTTEQIEEGERFRLDFVMPYALTVQALIRSGLREYVLAEELLDEAEARASKSGDQTAYQIAWAVRIRLYNSQGAFDLALGRALPATGGQTESLFGELEACQAVALAGVGELGRAREHATRAEVRSKAVEIAISAPCALAVASLREGNHDEALHHAKRGLISAVKSGMIECFVSAYRGCPELVVCLLEDLSIQDDLSRVITIAGDASLHASGESRTRSVLALSRREKEVLSLLSQGLSNVAIGEKLFISPVTVKVHVRHIFEKLGVRSRAEAALRAGQLGRN